MDTHEQTSTRTDGAYVVGASGGHQAAAERGELALVLPAARHGGAPAAAREGAAAARTAAARAAGAAHLDTEHHRHAGYP